MLSHRTRAKTGEKTCALTRVGTDTGKNGLNLVYFLHGQKRTVLHIFSTRAETGNAVLPDTGKNGRENLCIDTGGNGHGQKRTELGIFLTRAKTGVKTCALTRVETDTGKNGLSLVVEVHRAHPTVAVMVVHVEVKYKLLDILRMAILHMAILHMSLLHMSLLHMFRFRAVVANQTPPKDLAHVPLMKNKAHNSTFLADRILGKLGKDKDQLEDLILEDLEDLVLMELEVFLLDVILPTTKLIRKFVRFQDGAFLKLEEAMIIMAAVVLVAAEEEAVVAAIVVVAHHAER
ncbi:hypothetical protein QAD02_011813 [Eretmocerus hayati]|uniref:Uncharacterized protein n=1 Tax=Eretmocerus hayati TaxID=131215 RepID=A0ACC2NY28_9HYME|nr:hypothetical protein QAD02_011813 [Eretmocerus hayati]